MRDKDLSCQVADAKTRWTNYTRLGRLLPGQDFHLLEQPTFTAHLDHYTVLWYEVPLFFSQSHR